MWKCLECGRRFRTTNAAERAANNGCPGCGGVDIDLDVESERKQTEAGYDKLANGWIGTDAQSKEGNQ